MIRCAIFGHKTKLHTGGGTMEDWATATVGNTTLKMPWCYRCQKYIIPPLSVNLMIRFFPNG